MRWLIAVVLLLPVAVAGEFKSVKECVVGAKVADRQNRTGTITAVDRSMCEVAMEDQAKRTYLYWMLHAAGASGTLPAGEYKCTGRLSIRILGPTAYENVGKAGKYRVEAAGKIVFETGPLTTYTAELLPGPRIGLNANGSDFYSISCSLAKR